MEKAKASSFEREYNLKYLGKIGKVFYTKAAIEKGRKYDPDDFSPFYSFTSRSMGSRPSIR
jgi:hypothetical protein